MPKLEFGETAHFDGGGSMEYLKLTSKGESVHIRFLDSPRYSGKHFLQTEDGWEVPYCPRIMKNEKCEYCEKFFDAKDKIKALENKGELNEEEKKKLKELNKRAQRFQVSLAFYYPVLNRETKKAAVLETTQSVRWKLDQEVKDGIPVTEYDYKLTRTEKPGSDYYKLTRMPKEQTEDLIDKEFAEIKKTKKWDMDTLVYGKQSTFDMGKQNKEEAQEKPNEDVDPEEIPF